MIKFDRVETKNFSAEDLKKTYIGYLLTHIREATPCYVAKFNTDLVKFNELGTEYTEEFVVFELMKNGEIINFEKKSFPFVYNTSYDTTAITITAENEILYSEEADEELDYGKGFFMRYNDPEYNYSGFVNRHFESDTFELYLDALSILETGDTVDRIKIKSEVSIEGNDFITIDFNLVDYESAIFEYLLIFPRYSNMSPLLYGYLTFDDKIYRITGGDFCGNNLYDLVEE